MKGAKIVRGLRIRSLPVTGGKKKKSTTIKRPMLNTAAALGFDTKRAGKGQASKGQPGGKRVQTEPQGRSGLFAREDVRLTANIRKDLHLKLKIEAAQRRTTIGELIEDLVKKHL